MRAFELEIDAGVLSAIAEHAERDFPTEACGVVLGAPGASALTRVVPLKNMQDRYHAKDPIAFPRDGKDAFRLDELEHMRVLEDADKEGLVERILYHSHCDAGAYFSPEDRAMAVVDGLELLPGVTNLVISVRNGRRADVAAYRYDASAGCFLEARLGPEALGLSLSPGMPDLDLRQLEGKEAARPIRPVGGALKPRFVAAAEVEPLRVLAAGKKLRLENGAQEQDLLALALGLYSPLDGFCGHTDVRSIEQRGRLANGLPWRDSIRLELAKAKAPKGLLTGDVVEIEDKSGTPRAVLAVTEVRVQKDRIVLAGPVYVYPRPELFGPADTRAQLLRIGAQRVLALGAEEAPAPEAAALAGFDAILAWPHSTPAGSGKPCFLLSGTPRSPWLAAVMAQNQGATHLWLRDPGEARAIEETLAIRVWHQV